MFQLIGTPQGFEHFIIQLKVTPMMVYAIGAEFLVRRVPLGVLHNWVMIQLKDTPHIFENVQCLMKELFQTKQPCLVLSLEPESTYKSLKNYFYR